MASSTQYAKYSGLGGTSGGGGSGTVTSVGLVDGSSTPIYTITGSPVTTSGNLTFSLKNETANFVFAGPTNGAAAQPTFRLLVPADIPDISSLYWSLTGNAATTPGTNFVGTTDAQDLVFKTNALEAFRVDTSQRMGIGTNSPTYGLHFKEAGAAFTDGMVIEGSGANAARFWNLFADTTGFFYLRNPNETYFPLAFSNIGFMGVGVGSPLAQLHVFPRDAATTVNIVQGFASQVNDLTQWQDSATNVLAGVDPLGRVYTNDQFQQNKTVSNTAIAGDFALSTSLTLDGTTSSSQSVYANNQFLALRNTATITAGNNFFGNNLNMVLSDTAQTDGAFALSTNVTFQDSAIANNVQLGSFSLTVQDTANSGNITGVNTNIQIKNNAVAGGVIVDNPAIAVTDNAVINNLTIVNANPQISGAATMTGYTTAYVGGQFSGTSHSDNINGLSVNLDLSGSMTCTNFSPVVINPQISGTPTITNGVTFVNIVPSTVAVLQSATGLKVDMNSVQLDPVQAAAGNQIVGLDVQGQGNSISANIDTSIITVAGEWQHNLIGGTLHIASGFPLTGQFGFGNNTGVTILAEDDMQPDAGGLGFSLDGFASQVSVVAGKTFDTLNFMLAGASIPAPSTGGTVVHLNSYRAAGFIPSGGTLNVTNLKAFNGDPLLDSTGATNAWGVHIGATTVDNWFSKNVVVGGATEKPTNASVGIELAGTTKAVVLSRLTTAQRNALTATEGMIIENVSTHTIDYYNGTVWVSLTAATSSTEAQEVPAGLINNSNVTFTLANTPISDASVKLYQDGLFLRQGVDYTLAGAVITMTVAPTFGQTLDADYFF